VTDAIKDINMYVVMFLLKKLYKKKRKKGYTSCAV